MLMLLKISKNQQCAIMYNEKNIDTANAKKPHPDFSINLNGLDCFRLLEKLNSIDAENRAVVARNLVDGFIDLGEKLSVEPPGVNREKMYRKLLDERGILFGSSPCVLDYLSASEIVDIAVDKMNCVTLQGSLVSSIVCTLNFNLAFNDIDDPFLQKLNNSTPNKALGTLELMQAVAAESAANGEWAARTLPQILDTLDNYQPESILLDCFKEAVRQNVLLEEDNPSLGVIRYENDPNYGRMSIKMDDEEIKFEREVYSRLPANSIPVYHHIVKLGSDAIAVTDQALVPTHFANLDIDDSLKKIPRSKVPELMRNRIIEGCSEMLEITSDDTTREAVNFINYLHNKLMPFQTAKDWQSFLSEVLSADSIESLNRYADFQDNVDQFYRDKNQLFDTLSDETGLNNLKNVLSNFKEDYLKGVKDGNFKFELFPKRERDLQSQIRQLEAEISERIDREMANRAEGIMSELGDSRIDGKRIASETKAWLDTVPKSETINDLHFSKLADDEKYAYLKYLHHPQIRKSLKEITSIDARELSMATQVEFASFVINADKQTIERVAAASKRFIENDISPTAFSEAFLSLEFGEDFGDRILKISEKYEVDQSNNIFENINNIRSNSAEISEFFGDSPSDEICQSLRTAWIKRVTELLAVISDDNFSEKENAHAIQALNILGFASRLIRDGLKGDMKIHQETDQFITLKAEDGLTVTVRPSGESQRIGFTVNIPEELIPVDIEQKGKRKSNKRLNIRFDRDEFGPSLDIGSAASDNVNSSSVGIYIAEMLASGEHAISKNPAQLHGNHVREAFKDMNMSEEDFVQIARRFCNNLKLVHPARFPDHEKDVA